MICTYWWMKMKEDDGLTAGTNYVCSTFVLKLWILTVNENSLDKAWEWLTLDEIMFSKLIQKYLKFIVKVRKYFCFSKSFTRKVN